MVKLAGKRAGLRRLRTELRPYVHYIISGATHGGTIREERPGGELDAGENVNVGRTRPTERRRWPRKVIPQIAGLE